MMLTIFCNNNYKTEREYICNVLLNEFLGIEYEIEFQERNDWLMTYGDKDKKMLLPDVLFQTPPEDWLTERSLPSRPLRIWDISGCGIDCPVVNKNIPLIYADTTPVFSDSKAEPNIPVDIFGSAFFMLTCYEELAKPASLRDIHDRMPAAQSLAFQENFLSRPIVNEYLEILWACLHRLWPQLNRKYKKFRCLPSHDVDIPFKYRITPIFRTSLSLGADFIFRRDIRLGTTHLIDFIKVTAGRKNDPFDTFDLIMNLSEKYGLKSAFYFMTGGNTKYDGYGYPIDHPLIQGIISKIMNRGHEIGFHPSYLSAANQAVWNSEFNKLVNTDPGLHTMGGRQHYLRFKIPLTWRFWAGNRFRYDCSIMFADHSGFRCGTCYEFQVYDLLERTILPIKERPLIVMERTVIDKDYMGLESYDKVFEYVHGLKRCCRLFNGNFTILWHNNRLVEYREIDLYESILKA
jgi:Family of unknown function (DUF7033)